MVTTVREDRLKRKARTRYAIRASANGRLRLSVFRSHRHIYAQVIDDAQGKTVASASTLDKALRAAKAVSFGNKKHAAKVGKTIAERTLKSGVKEVVFDRGGCIYHGCIKSLAEAARAAGLSF